MRLVYLLNMLSSLNKDIIIIIIIIYFFFLLFLSSAQTWSLESKRRDQFEIGSALFVEIKQISSKASSKLVS